MSCVCLWVLVLFGFLGVSHAAVYRVTGYCACPICCPAQSGLTAAGNVPRQGVDCAGPLWFRPGTRVVIPGVGARVVTDRMARRFQYSRRIDVFFASHAQAKRFGVRYVEIGGVR